MPSSSSTTDTFAFMELSGFFLLAGVFVVAGIAKLSDRRKTASGFASLAAAGALPKVLVNPLASAVPLVELGLAAGLVLQLPIAALAASILLAAFTITLYRALRTAGLGTDLDTDLSPVTCNCFGALSTDAVTGVSLARNALLIVVSLAVAALALVQPSGVQDATSSDFLAAALSAGLVALIGSFGLALAHLRSTVGGIFSAQPTS
jgi:hypothetical protein